MKKYLIVLVVLLLFCAGCKAKNNKTEGEYKMVTCEEKNELVQTGAILLDVRSQSEYDEDHLDGAINLEYTELESKFNNLGYTKETKIVVYCRSGKRSSIAAETLKNMGYLYVYDLGSINNCK